MSPTTPTTPKTPKTPETSKSPSNPRGAPLDDVHHDLSCSWVPGTTDVVRLRLGARSIEMTSTRLQRIFGRQATADLYLRGRVHLKASAQQLALLT